MAHAQAWASADAAAALPAESLLLRRLPLLPVIMPVVLTISFILADFHPVSRPHMLRPHPVRGWEAGSAAATTAATDTAAP